MTCAWVPWETGPIPAPLASGPVLEVNLQAIVDNHRTLRRRFTGTAVTAVIKSDAYGLGAQPVAQALAETGCGTFWVNDLIEALALRPAVPKATIYALQGLGVDAVEGFRAAGVIPVLAGLAEVERAAEAARHAGAALPVAIQLDTGLGRLGLPAGEVECLIAAPELTDGLDIRCWVSHLAAFDRPEDPLNDRQRALFEAWTARLPSAALSLAASACVFRGPGWHFDLARAGSAHFGVQTSARWQPGLTAAYRLTAPVLRIVELPAGRTVGYRGVGRLVRPTRVATIDLGYANGLPPAVTRGGAARIGTHAVPFVGGASMSLTMLDVTDLPEGLVQVGTRCVVFDTDAPIEPVADRLGVAPNALLTQIAGTTPKLYRATTGPVVPDRCQPDRAATAAAVSS